MFGCLEKSKPKDEPVVSSNSEPKPILGKKRKQGELRNKADQRVTDNLIGAKFRMINEYFYSNKSREANKYFKSNKNDFKLYHEGFEHQIEKWSVKPVQLIIDFIKKSQFLENKIICDLGCGEGKIEENFTKQKGKGFDYVKQVISYDLVALKPFIIETDISKLPLQKETVGACVFCLSLMGTNYLQFLQEAHRVLKPNGWLLIAEVSSRIQYPTLFAELVSSQGFQLQFKQCPNTFFVFFQFKKIPKTDDLVQKFIQKHSEMFKSQAGDINAIALQALKPCLYKKR